MKEKLKQFVDDILQVVYPDDYKCIFCGKELVSPVPTRTCKECEKCLPFIKGNICLICGDRVEGLSNYCLRCKEQVRYFTVARAPFVFDGKISNAIHKFKYENAKYLFKPMASFMSKVYFENNFKPEIILAVPMFRSREVSRGYNQAKLLAKELSKLVDVPLFEDILIKEKNTPAQTELSFFERQENLKDVFKVVKPEKIKGKNILLVDDVMTTGSTANYCCKSLTQAGAEKVFVLTLARTLGRQEI